MAVCMPFAAWIALEGLLHLHHPGFLHYQHDPWLGFSAHIPLWHHNTETGRYELAKSHRYAFEPTGFSYHKSEDTFRIFCLGGSTVQGRPYGHLSAFPAWMKIWLEKAYPRKTFEIINVGGVSYASYRLVPILKECLGHQPDLIILCTGHNEFLENRSYDLRGMGNDDVGPWMEWSSRSKVFEAFTALTQHALPTRKPLPRLGAKVQAMLDFERGLEQYHRNEAWASEVETHFRDNVQTMIRKCQAGHVPMLLLNPCFNLKDSPPFKSEHRPDWTPEQAKAWSQLISSAREHLQGDPDESIHQLSLATSMDPQFARTWYDLGKLLFGKARWQEAKACFQRALEEDVCPLRIRNKMRQSLEAMAQTEGVPMLDLQTLAEAQNPWGVAGESFLVDHVHPSISGHQIIAQTLAAQIALDFLPRPRQWPSTQEIESLFADHYQKLPPSYLAEGLQRLENLRAWTQGKADGPVLESGLNHRNGL